MCVAAKAGHQPAWNLSPRGRQTCHASFRESVAATQRFPLGVQDRVVCFHAVLCHRCKLSRVSTLIPNLNHRSELIHVEALTPNPCHRYELSHVVRTHMGAQDASYGCVFQHEDADGQACPDPAPALVACRVSS